MTPAIAVITGDLIGSTKVEPARVELSFDILRDAMRRMGEQADLDPRFTRFRGDGWQIALDFPGLALRASLMAITALRAEEGALDTRVSIGIGPVRSLGSTDLSDASGTAFVLSGQTLDQMPKSHRIAYGGPHVHDPWLGALFPLIDWIAARWSPEQAQAIALDLQDDSTTQTSLAERLGISRQALKARLDSAGLTALRDAIHAFEAADWEADTDA